MNAMSATEMAKHIEGLCAAHQIEVSSHSRGGRAYRRTRRVDIRPVRSAVTYAVALHEFGHILGENQTRSCLERETGPYDCRAQAYLDRKYPGHVQEIANKCFL